MLTSKPALVNGQELSEQGSAFVSQTLQSRASGVHLGSRGRQIPEFQAGLGYTAHSSQSEIHSKTLYQGKKRKQTEQNKPQVSREFMYTLQLGTTEKQKSIRSSGLLNIKYKASFDFLQIYQMKTQLSVKIRKVNSQFKVNRDPP